jgi:tRNA G18 (ribose-2'-O)-methylase SpoU
LIDAKYPHNVGGVLRAAAILGAEIVRWTGDRAPPVRAHGGPKRTALPCEERLKDYQRVDFAWTPEASPEVVDAIAQGRDLTPVALEVRKNAEALPDFIHPERALYVFGPEDGTLGRGVLSRCHRFVCIPSLIRSPLNLAAASTSCSMTGLQRSGRFPGRHYLLAAGRTSISDVKRRFRLVATLTRR